VAARHRQLALWVRLASMAAWRFPHPGTILADSAKITRTAPHRTRSASSHALSLHACDSGDGAMLLFVSEAPTEADERGVVPLTALALPARPTGARSLPPGRRSRCHAPFCTVSATAQPQTTPCAHHRGRLLVHQLTFVVHVCVRLGMGQSESNARCPLPPPPPSPLSPPLAHRHPWPLSLHSQSRCR
jgi:hypothetical protein